MSLTRPDIYAVLGRHDALRGYQGPLTEKEYAEAIGYYSFHESVSRFSAEANHYNIIRVSRKMRHVTDTYRAYLDDISSVDIRNFVLEHKRFREWWESMANGGAHNTWLHDVPYDYRPAFEVGSAVCGFYDYHTWFIGAIRDAVNRKFTLPELSRPSATGTKNLIDAVNSIRQGNDKRYTAYDKASGVRLDLTGPANGQNLPKSFLYAISSGAEIEEIESGPWKLTVTRHLTGERRRYLVDFLITASEDLIAEQIRDGISIAS